MKTEILKINPSCPDEEKIAYAAKTLKNGGLVAFPTETVYGLGANALNEAAVKNIFTAKGRPSDNPLIVHISSMADLDSLVAEIPENANALIKTFWPGPLTLVMKKSKIVPPIITAGLQTVAVRMPSNQIAARLIALSGVPVAAPSANSSGRPSPTCAAHVIEDLYGKVDIIIDGGTVEVGLESTVLDITCHPPVILRPGAVTSSMLSSILGEIYMFSPASEQEFEPAVIPRSPGMKYRHYAPKARITVFEGQPELIAREIELRWMSFTESGMRTIILSTDETIHLYQCKDVISMGSRTHPETIASGLFKILRQMDSNGVSQILAEAIPADGIGLAVMNRLVKASGNNIVKVDKNE